MPTSTILIHPAAAGNTRTGNVTDQEPPARRRDFTRAPTCPIGVITAELSRSAICHAEDLLFDAAFAEQDDGEVLGDYGWEPNTQDDGFMPDGTIWMATEVCNGSRIILEAVLDNGVCFLAEFQAGGPPWSLERQWGCTEWGRPRMPRTAGIVMRLSEDIRAWLTNNAGAEQ